MKKLVLFMKSHVSGYTRKDGVAVKPHEDKRLPDSHDSDADDVEINGKRFAASKTKIKAGHHGYYSVSKNGVHFHSPEGTKVAVVNKNGVMGAAWKQRDGRYIYNYGEPSIIGKHANHADKTRESEAVAARFLKS
jgi:hypothetical protein